SLEDELPAAKRWDMLPLAPIRPSSKKSFKPLQWDRSMSDTFLQPLTLWVSGCDPYKGLESLIDFPSLLDFKGDPDDENFIPIAEQTVERIKRFLAPQMGIMGS